MPTDTRIAEMLEKLEEDRRRLDGAVDSNIRPIAVANSLIIAVASVVSCLLAAAPPVTTVVSGIGVGLGTYAAFLVLFKLAGEQLFPGSFGPEAERQKSPRAAKRRRRERPSVGAARERRPAGG